MSQQAAIATPKSNKVLTRQQRRLQERITEEAKETHERLAENFLVYFSQHENPEGEEVQERIKQVNAQWKLYCSRRQLTPQAFTLLEQFIDGILKQYRDSKG